MSRSVELALTTAMAGDRLSVYPSFTRLVLTGASAFAFAAGGCWLVVAVRSPLAMFAGALGIALGLLAVIACVKLTRTRGVPVIAFDADGVAFRGPFEKQFLLWVDLRAAYIANVYRQRFVCLVPYDIAAVLAEAPAARRKMMEANVSLTGAPFALPTTSTLAPEQLLAIVAAYRARASGTGDAEEADVPHPPLEGS